ncbi:MAG: HAD-IA family hydrolase [Chloroflexi bacterium]|nr:HAD-IA family hydrolase [Chloroflexota bacterium]
MIRNVIWDVDGTLFDTYPSIVRAFFDAAESLGRTADPTEVGRLSKVGLTHCTQELALRLGLDGKDLGTRFAAFYRAIPPALQPPFDGVRHVCEDILAHGGTNAILTHRGRASTLELLSTHCMAPLFSAILAAQDGLPKKPDPAGILRLLEQLRLDAAQTVALGDRDIDILAGKAAGLRTCLYRGEPGHARPDFAFLDFADLVGYLQLS